MGLLLQKSRAISKNLLCLLGSSFLYRLLIIPARVPGRTSVGHFSYSLPQGCAGDVKIWSSHEIYSVRCSYGKAIYQGFHLKFGRWGSHQWWFYTNLPGQSCELVGRGGWCHCHCEATALAALMEGYGLTSLDEPSEPSVYVCLGSREKKGLSTCPKKSLHRSVLPTGIYLRTEGWN